jgi:hypothetical protein
MKAKNILTLTALALAISGVLLATMAPAHNKTEAARPKVASSPLAQAAEQAATPTATAEIYSNPDREVFFGQTHVHTGWSMDAFIIGNTTTGPAEAYQYAIGEPVKHPGGYTVQLKRPLDFQGVTDHSEYLGMVRLANDPTSPVSKLPVASKLKANTPEEVVNVFKFLVASLASGKPMTELLQPKLMASIWDQNVQIADKYYKPGKFTTFVSYEWTSAPASQNMHRNVFFRDSKKVPSVPFTALDSVHPEDLWAWMDTQRTAGNEVLAISHNGNLSNGIMFPVSVDSKGKPLTEAWAKDRLANEPLSEIHQLKGTSETTPQLSPNDEFADYELMSFLLGTDNSTSNPHGGFFREAWQNGMAMQVDRGYNPYKFGVVAASDSHNTVVSYAQNAYDGGHASLDATPKARLAGKIEAGMEVLKLSTSGLAGVWAEQNTRESIFDAMRRKETYGTSGVRIKVRLFGGWDYKQSLFDQRDWVKVGYRDGVPMGADLPPKTGAAPTFVVWALKDPDDANLDRIQIVKGWTKDTKLFEQVYDVAWSDGRKPDGKTGRVPAVKSTVDIKNASYTNTVGATELKKVWRDPDFDPSLHAFYYVRVLQIPTPRWSTYDAKKLGVDPPKRVSPTVQERAWTTPIWYTPNAAVARARKPGQLRIATAERDATRRMTRTDRELLNVAAGQ